MDRKKLLLYYNKAKDEYEHFKPTLMKAYKYIQYNNKSWNTNNDANYDIGIRTDNKTYATYISQYTSEFANNLANAIFPYGVKFFNLTYDNEEISDIEKKTLNKISDLVFHSLLESNFYQEITKSFKDIAIGTGALLMNYNTNEKKIYFKALPSNKVFFLEDDSGLCNYVFRHLGILSAEDRERLYPTIDFKERGNLELIEYIIPDYDGKKKRFKHCITDHQFSNIYLEQYWDNNPFIIFRWNTYTEENIGRGILIENLATLNLINKMEEDVLKATELTISPPFITNDPTLLDMNKGLDFSPGSLIKLSMNSEMKQLQTVNNLPFAIEHIQMKYQEVINALGIRPLSDMNSKEMTATEVTARLNQQINILGGFANRHIRELIQPILYRAIELLIIANRINKDDVKGHVIKYENPITKLNSQIQAQGLLNALGQLNAIGGQQGQAVINSTIKRGSIAENLVMKATGIDPSYYNSAEQIDNNLQQIETAQQQQQFLQLQANNPNLQQIMGG
jgi:hypothetical protein